ncbi:hypothetical protein FQR65_LT16121 [Abscondita terminalis]|nr:hypothetical protein FQR65_LT16121 [Abscondita terminalis]
MRRQKLFESVHKNINKFEIRLDKYQIPPIPDANFYPQEEEGEYLKSKEENSRNFPAFTPQYVRDEPKLCVWNYMNENDVKKLLQITSKKEIRKTIGNNMDAEYPKGISRLLIIELMYSILQFCKKSKFNVMQTGSLLSIFYLTHQYFLSSLYTTPEKIFIFFKDNLLLNCLEVSFNDYFFNSLIGNQCEYIYRVSQ